LAPNPSRTGVRRAQATIQGMNLSIEWLPSEGAPEQLILLLHGWGSDGRAMAPLAQALRLAFPQAAVLAPDAPHPFERGGTQRQWYGVDDLTPDIWPQRVAAALPGLRDWVQAQQQRLRVGPAATALGGFSQGAILSMALALADDGIAGRVMAFGGCLVGRPLAAPRHTTLHLFHGGEDSVIPADGSRQALAWLDELRGDATLDIAQGIGHELHPALIDCALYRLRSHIPLRTWQAALGAAPPLDS
jgi:phospholipase/carboxylesterase